MSYLTCGCCGKGFKVWEGYEDQDQDAGYGHCYECQEEIKLRNWFERANMLWLLLDNFKNPLNRFRLYHSPPEVQNYYISKAFEDGILTWHIGR